MSSPAIIGLEGHVPTDAAVAWGAAAIQENGLIRNSLSGAKTRSDAALDLLAQHALTLFDSRVEVEESQAQAPLIALMVNRRHPYAKFFRLDTGREGAVVAHGLSKAWWYYVFHNRALFDVYAETVATRVLTDLFRRTEFDTDATGDLLRWALTLAPSHPGLLACRVQISPNPEIMERFARASLRTDEAKDDFARLLDALRDVSSEWVLKYDGGIAEGRGLDVADGERMLREIHVSEEHVIPFVRAQYDFLPHTEGARFSQFAAHSAKLTFVPTVKDQTIGDRVARYITMYWVQEMLRGHTPPIKETKSLHEALDYLSAPTEGTKVTQTRLNAHEPETLEPRPRLVGARVEDERVIRVLGIVSGLSKGTKLEIALARNRVAFVSTLDDGSGERPKGVEAIEGRADFLRQPALATLRRRTFGGSERFDLLALTLLRSSSAGTGVVDSLPSAVVTGAYIHLTQSLAVRAEQGGIVVDTLGQLAHPGRSRASERNWLQDLEILTAKLEMAITPLPAAWIPPAGGYQPKAIERLLIALQARNGRASVNELVAYVQVNFADSIIRANNTLREIRKHDKVLKVDQHDASVVTFTPEGQRRAAILTAVFARSR